MWFCDHKRLVIVVCILIVLTTPRWLLWSQFATWRGPGSHVSPSGPRGRVVTSLTLSRCHHQPRGRRLWPSHQWTQICQRYRYCWSFILITKTPESRYIFSLMIIDFSRVCSHTRHGLLVPGSLPLCCCHQVEKQAFWHPDGGKTSLFNTIIQW